MDDDIMFTIASDSSSAASEDIIYSNQVKKNKENDVSEVYSSSRNKESNHHTEENDSDEVYFSSASESPPHSPQNIYSTPIQKQDETNVHDLYVDDTKTSVIDSRRKSNSAKEHLRSYLLEALHKFPNNNDIKEWEIKFKKIFAEEDLTNSGNEDGIDKSKEQQPSDNTKETTKSSTGSEDKKSNNYDTKAVREYFEGFYQQQYIFGSAINAWALVLNHEEQRKSKDSPSRFFFPIFSMTDDLLKKCKSKNMDVFEEVFDLFYSFIGNSLNRNKDLIDLKPFDMVFFPMHDENENHYYVIVFNLLKGEGVVLDNIKKTRSRNVGYGGVTYHIKRLFFDYLMVNENEKASIFKDICLRQEQMKWCTTKNIYDCGIFAMRHMETYKGQEEGKWSCGLPPEGPKQYRLIQILRAKYMFKILNSDINLRREKVIDEANFFATISTTEQEMLLKRAELDIVDRFD
ncbi:hypothetical protein LXL04_022132 [Taraxacum kok-saghyz]